LSILAWEDTKYVRPEGSRAIVFLNDSEHEPPSSVLEAFRNYEIEPVMWSAREEAGEMLAA